jgi:acetyl-CoA synthetase
MEHPAVVEAAVVGKSDPQRGELVKAFVVLKAGFEPSGDLGKELQNLVRDRYSKHAYPREIDFLPDLPKTESGKVMRRELRKRA